MSDLEPEVERALEYCGRHRVFHNYGAPPAVPPMVAIHGMTPTDWRDQFGEQKTIYGKADGPGEGLNAAGRRAARAFAKRLREQGTQLLKWAGQIEGALRQSGDGASEGSSDAG